MSKTTMVREDHGKPSSLETCLLYAIFLGTGVAVVLPGAMMPLFLAHWRFSDSEGGVFFFLFFLGSTAGAFFSRGKLSKAIVLGCAAVAAGIASLAFASREVAFVAIVLYGLGLGITMTSISLSRARCSGARRTAEMARLNLVWAIGACLGPALVLRSAVAIGLSSTLIAVAAPFLIAAGLVAVFFKEVNAASTATHSSGQKMPLIILCMVPFATGIEAAAGGWLTTYSKRSGQTFGEVIGVVTCFWAGMLLSRLLQSHQRIAKTTTIWFLAGLPWVMFMALGLLLYAVGDARMLAGAFLLGLAAGPMYPLLIALALRGGGGDNVIFVLGGCGASLLPLLTGVVSGRAGSLHAGIRVPLAGAFALGCLGLVGWRKVLHDQAFVEAPGNKA